MIPTLSLLIEHSSSWLNVTVLFLLAALISLVLSAMGKCPLWVPVLCLCVAALVQAIPKE